MKHSTGLLSRLVWSCEEYAHNSYGSGLNSDIGRDVCQRCSLDPGQMFHASIIRTPDSQGTQQYDMHFVHLLITGGDAEVQVCQLGISKAQQLHAVNVRQALIHWRLLDVHPSHTVVC